MLDIISIGDVTEDVFVQVDDMELVCAHNKKNCLLCMKYADKIIAKKVDKLIGGNAGNIAIGTKRLGFKSALYAQVGQDDQGRLLYDSIKKEHVDTSYFTLAKNELTNYSVVIIYHGERTILVHHEKRNYLSKNIGKCKWVYLTSMGDGSEKFYDMILMHKKKYNSLIGFNPGSHQLKWGFKKMSKLLASSEVTSLNVEETQFLFQTKNRNIQNLLMKLHNAGARIALITDGPSGSYVYDGKEFYFCPIYDVPVLERTGCGDSYTGAFISALMHGKDIKEAMRWGTLNAAGVVQRTGPQNGLIKLSNLLKILKANPKFKVRILKTASVTTGNKYKPVRFAKF